MAVPLTSLHIPLPAPLRPHLPVLTSCPPRHCSSGKVGWEDGRDGASGSPIHTCLDTGDVYYTISQETEARRGDGKYGRLNEEAERHDSSGTHGHSLH